MKAAIYTRKVGASTNDGLGQVPIGSTRYLNFSRDLYSQIENTQ